MSTHSYWCLSPFLKLGLDDKRMTWSSVRPNTPPHPHSISPPILWSLSSRCTSFCDSTPWRYDIQWWCPWPDYGAWMNLYNTSPTNLTNFMRGIWSTERLRSAIFSDRIAPNILLIPDNFDKEIIST